MSSSFKNKKRLRAVFLMSTLLFSVALLLFGTGKSIWTIWDYKILDYFYRAAVKNGHGPDPSFSPRILYLNITEESYDYFGKHLLDRGDLAPLNPALAQMGVEGIIYDIIFARAGDPVSDDAFAKSIDGSEMVHLPIAFALSDHPTPFQWQDNSAYDRIRRNYSEPIHETHKEKSRPFHAVKALTQYPPFATVAAGSGDITAQADTDSIYRHVTLLTQIDNRFYPAFSLAIFMDWAGVTMADLTVEWGKQITIPATRNSFLEEDVIVPIDERGRAFIPYVDGMGKDFQQMAVHRFLTHFQDPDLHGNLLDFFEGNYVFIGDIAAGTSDLGYTPLEADVPLITIHAAMLNALLTNTFYTEWSRYNSVMAVFLILIILTVTACFRSSWMLYSAGLLMVILLPVFTWFELLRFSLFPIATFLTFFLISFSSLIIFLEISTSKDRSFIKRTFGRYVPERVVDTLLDRPEMISLGGEERVVTVLFSDLAGFTTISEQLSPKALVALLNEYFTEMAQIIMSHGGIIDKFQGDAIMAEFGMPVPSDDHGDQAVTAAVAMLRKLSELRVGWKKRGIPELQCRIGINTGKVIVGNMGSKTAMDYTVMGDAVNLASRLEGANKYYDTHLMISEFTLKQLPSRRFQVRILDFVKVKGKRRAVKIYEVYGIHDSDASAGMKKKVNNNNGVIQSNPSTLDSNSSRLPDSEPNKSDSDQPNVEDFRYHTIYDRAFNAYLNKEFSQAATLFSEALILRPEDKASIKMLNRLEKLGKDMNPDQLESWDGSVALDAK